MSSSRRHHHHQTVDKLDRTITRLYTYLSGSEEGDEPLATAASTSQQVGSSSRRLRQQQNEPEYQQPYAYPAAHAHPFNPLAAASGSTPNSSSNSSSDNHTSSTTLTTTGGGGTNATLLLAGTDDVDSSLSHHSLHRHRRRRQFQGTFPILFLLALHLLLHTHVYKVSFRNYEKEATLFPFDVAPTILLSS